MVKVGLGTLPKITARTMGHWAGLSERFSDLTVRQEVGFGCPSRFPRLSTARTKRSDLLSDGQVRELLGHAGPMSHWAGSPEQLIPAVKCGTHADVVTLHSQNRAVE
ncbi:hypothetical protein PSTG_00748 [Puccinia striiformis f. sp. tritici PST-78]|uniref:Uncharacterized protein n=1 Tax=Puccinia striiformis f. sp. tritici PST-78 TaxID=1165861 RepID=A0A0L0W403_9BASI|nr:hypothetical protein PSTG_00748 [Puccinia striiformis f. sp. tritici PST-78]